MGRVQSVNVAAPQATTWTRAAKATGINKVSVAGPVAVSAPTRRTSGLAGDLIGNPRHHGGPDQAVYAFEREDLDLWQDRLGRVLDCGAFGENLTTWGVELGEALIGERWRVGAELELQVSCPRTPCATFRGWMAEPGWARRFTAEARPGAYLRVVRPGPVQAGDPVEISWRPEHPVTVSRHFRALTSEPELLGDLLPAQDFLDSRTLTRLRRRGLLPSDLEPTLPLA